MRHTSGQLATAMASDEVTGQVSGLQASMGVPRHPDGSYGLIQ